MSKLARDCAWAGGEMTTFYAVAWRKEGEREWRGLAAYPWCSDPAAAERIKEFLEQTRALPYEYALTTVIVDCSIAEAHAQNAMSEWISVKDRLPEYDTDVHIWALGWDRVYLGYWRHSEEWIGRQRPEENKPLPDTNPTHWMPMPKPPSRESAGCDRRVYG